MKDQRPDTRDKHVQRNIRYVRTQYEVVYKVGATCQHLKRVPTAVFNTVGYLPLYPTPIGYLLLYPATTAASNTHRVPTAVPHP